MDPVTVAAVQAAAQAIEAARAHATALEDPAEQARVQAVLADLLAAQTSALATERPAPLLALRAADKTDAQIAEVIERTPARVRQILEASTPEQKAAAAERRAETARVRRAIDAARAAVGPPKPDRLEVRKTQRAADAARRAELVRSFAEAYPATSNTGLATLLNEKLAPAVRLELVGAGPDGKPARITRQHVTAWLQPAGTPTTSGTGPG